MVRISATIALIALQFAAFAQYQFESKKAEKLYNKLEEYYAEADYEGILKNQNNIEELYLTKEDTLAALMYSFLAESELMLNSDVKKSIELYEKELALRNKVLKGDFEKKDLLFNIASLKDELGLYNETEELYLDMIASDEKEYGSKSKQYYESSYALADRYFQTQEIDKGQPLVRKLRRLVDKNSYEEAMVLKLSGDFKGLQGQYKKAEEEKLKGLRILEENGLEASLEYVFSLNNLATVYLEAGKIPLAEEAMLKAISIIDRLQGEHEDLKAALNGNLAQVYYEFGNYGQAEELYDEILETEKEFYGEESVDYGFTCYNVALNYLFGGNYSKSQEYNEKATAIFANTLGEESTDYARSINAMLILQVKKKNKELGLKYGQQAIGLYKKVFGNNNPNAAFPVFYLANIHQIFDNLDEAEKLHKEAYNLWRKSLGTNHPDFALSANKLATLNWKKEDYKTALEYYDQVFENYTNRINAYFPVLSEEEKSKFYYNSLKPAFEQFNSFIVETSPDQKELIGRMYDLQLTTKGIIMYATNKVRESIVNSGDSVLIDKYETWIGQKEQLAKLYSASDLDLDERNRKIDSLGESSNALEKELSKLSGVFAQTFTNRELTWRDVKAKLKPGEAAVEIIRFRDFTPDSSGVFTDEVYYAALIVTSETEDYPEMVLMRNGKLMETKYLANYRNAIKYQVNENYSYRLFWRPIANRLKGIDKIYFSPDGVYNQISIYTLRNPATNNFSIDEFEIQLVTNTKDLVAFNFEEQTNFDQKSYLFGYPNYNMGVIDQQKENTESNNASKAAKAASENRGTRGGVRGARGSRGSADDLSSLSRGGLPRGIRGNLLRYMRSNQLLALLPGTQREVNLIDSLHQKEDLKPVIYMSDEAIEERIKEVRSPQTLHIATHGFFLEHEESDGESDQYVANPLLRSGLILAGANSYISEGQISAEKQFDDDGILTAYEAMNLRLDDTELVVLSACETGLGEVKNGEGVYGLQRAFQIAGAEAIIMSMWTVDDDATQELMTNFYEEWLSSGDKHKSFITAQKRLKEKRKAPYYWGAFVMVGN